MDIELPGTFLIIPETWIAFGEGILDFFLDPFIGAIKRVLHLLWSDVRAAIDQVLTFVDNRIRWVLNQIPDPFDVVDYIAQVLSNFVFNQLPDLVSGLIRDAVDFAVSGFNALLADLQSAYNFVVDLVNEAWNLAQEALSQVEDFLGSVGDLLEAGFNKALDFVEHAISDVIDFLTNFVNDAIDTLRNDILPAIENFLDDLFPWLGDLGKLWSDIFGWLVWIARLPFEGVDAFEHLIADRLTYANVKGQLDHVPGWIGDVESAIVHVLG